MLTITLKFGAELVPLLRVAASRRTGIVVRKLPASTSVKDAVEGAAVPHCEIGSVTDRTGSRRSLGDPLRQGDELTVAGVVDTACDPARFLCDRHLGRLARLLRTLGFDTTCGEDRTAAWLDDYFLCGGCGRLYWEGTHVTALRTRLAAILADEVP